ncbi:hypothetical protein G7062_08010 [Erysipelothrix sp. HDW6C]|uniref:hypothetical protein n=1 Tax=Erysipelothrix sp. HDW6C TaxID=2714930 RepID=UPI00140BC547|nr:hypothetical protein [Erysipelothrix sp. HDW6C]QIK70238.1 hypothetical protein G7062_08010 [Erysipelothrix sp. HDW6C]
MEWYMSVGSFPDREDLVATIFYQSKTIVEVSQENGFFEVCFYENDNKSYPLDEVLEMLDKAKKKLYRLRLDDK